MRVLITGGAGFLGSHLSDAFIARGDEVFVLDTGSIAKVRHMLNNPRFHYVHDSVFNLELIDSLVSKVDLDLPSRGRGRRRALRRRSLRDAQRQRERHAERAEGGLQAQQASRVQLDFRSVRTQSEGAVARGRRSRARRDQHRPLVLLDLEGGRRAFLFCLSQARHAGDGRALLQRVRSAAGQGRRRAGCSRSSWGNCCAART